MVEKIFANQAAVITGAGEGIGYAIARQLALGGASVLLNDMNEVLAQQAAAQIQAEGGVCIGIGGDVADVTTVRGLVAKTVQHFGRLDMAVANAGITIWGSFWDYTPENFERVLNVNLRGSFFLAQASAHQMRQQGSGGRIVLMSSVTGHQAVKYLSAYGMTKAALEMLARNLVIELSPYHITINAIAPGATNTPRNVADDPNFFPAWSSVIPLQRPAEADDIANAALFFLSPASGYITGQTLVVDGGWSRISPTPSLDFAEKK
jgi:3-oxoacyl-[acyl-carrier protein] reductase